MRQVMIDQGDGLPGKVVKFDIGDGSIYLKFAADEHGILWIDVVISSTGDLEVDPSVPLLAITNSKLYNNRSLVELVCHTASVLLQTDVWTIADVISSWRGTKFDPAGLCPQLNCIVSSPLDAIARYLAQKGVCDES